jgi:hypothetical protein
MPIDSDDEHEDPYGTMSHHRDDRNRDGGGTGYAEVDADHSGDDGHGRGGTSYSFGSNTNYVNTSTSPNPSSSNYINASASVANGGDDGDDSDDGDDVYEMPEAGMQSRGSVVAWLQVFSWHHFYEGVYLVRCLHPRWGCWLARLCGLA